MFSHVYQVVSRAVPSGRAKNSIYLMGQSVPPPDKATMDHWIGLMATVAAPQDSDARTTIGNASDVVHAATPMAPSAPQRRRRSLLKRIFGKRK